MNGASPFNLSPTDGNDRRGNYRIVQGHQPRWQQEIGALLSSILSATQRQPIRSRRTGVSTNSITDRRKCPMRFLTLIKSNENTKMGPPPTRAHASDSGNWG